MDSRAHLLQTNGRKLWREGMEMTDMTDADVIDNVDRHRFELVVDGHTAFAEYRIDDDVITFTHTIVPPAIGGRGVAGRLIGAALHSAEERGLKVVPQCSFVAAYFQKHPELAGLLA